MVSCWLCTGKNNQCFPLFKSLSPLSLHILYPFFRGREKDPLPHIGNGTVMQKDSIVWARILFLHGPVIKKGLLEQGYLGG